MAKSTAKSPRKTKTIPYDVAEQLRTPEEMAAYLDAWFEEAPDDAAGIARALGDIARARGMTQVARDAGLSRESLYKALSEDGNPSFATVLKVGAHSASDFTRKWQRPPRCHRGDRSELGRPPESPIGREQYIRPLGGGPVTPAVRGLGQPGTTSHPLRRFSASPERDVAKPAQGEAT